MFIGLRPGDFQCRKTFVTLVLVEVKRKDLRRKRSFRREADVIRIIRLIGGLLNLRSEADQEVRSGWRNLSANISAA